MTDTQDSKLVSASRSLAIAIRTRRERANKNAAKGEMTLLDHLAELRVRLAISLVAIVVGGVIAFFLWNWILQVATDPYCQAQIARDAERAANGQAVSTSGCQLYISNPLELLSTRVAVSAYLGAFFASPVLLWQLWRFITPGLEQNEKKYAVPFVASSVVLFVFGCVVAWFTLPQAMKFFLAVGGDEIDTLFNPTPYLKLIFLMMLLFGVAFETPLLLIFLQIAGVIKSMQLRKFRRYALVGNSVLAAVATPSADPISMMAMYIPLVIFYEIAIVVGRAFGK